MEFMNSLSAEHLSQKVVEGSGGDKELSARPYLGKTAVLTTKHGKLNAIALPVKAGIELRIATTTDIDTDQLGTFAGEVERLGTPLATAIQKARLGMERTGCTLGLATEGSFGPHPFIPFLAGHQEVIVFIDDNFGTEVSESIFSTQTNFSHALASSIGELADFLKRCRFPSHGLIVRPNAEIQSQEGYGATIVKGIETWAQLEAAIDTAKKKSTDGLARIETDMRAHMNPLRQRIIRKLAIKLTRRLMRHCSQCSCPGFGITGSEGRLSCSDCGSPSETPAREIHSCQKCKFKESILRQDGLRHLDPKDCQRCNP
ncbi:MAG: hypothetical protein K2W95_06630 [Candidatus Obscuribacterales bacterium]|nr:hypothetical protein [Candidatus Obscuribacterales bacterium]